MSDAYYSTEDIEKALCEAFGSETRLFGQAQNTKLAVTMTAVEDCLPTIACNYNGLRRLDFNLPDQGYQAIRSGRTEDEIMVWQACAHPSTSLIRIG